MPKGSAGKPKTVVVHRGPRSELKQYDSQMAAGVLAANAWTTYSLCTAIVNGNTSTTRVGRTIRVRRIQVRVTWLPYQAGSCLVVGNALFRSDALTSGAFTAATHLDTLLQGMATAYGKIVRGSPTQLMSGQWVAGEEPYLEFDWNCNLLVEFDAAGAIQGHSPKFFLNTDVTLSQFTCNRTVWFTDE